MSANCHFVEAAVTPFLGCIADDVTGATDLATSLVQGGMQVIQWLQIPTEKDFREHLAPATIIALKIRSKNANDAVVESLQALRALQKAACQRFYFKYCSTFDSTEVGNIGPIADALADALAVDQTVFCPAFPQAGRTVYHGHLFVADRLLHESGMERHPLNPMKDANLLRVLAKQTSGRVGSLPYAIIDQGPQPATEALRELAARGVSRVILDCLCNRHLQSLAQALIQMPLLTGGSGIARYLPDAYRSAGLLGASSGKAAISFPAGSQAVVNILNGQSGCS